MLEHMHRHWCAYLSHGGLTEESFVNVKKDAGETLTELQSLIFPWNVKEKSEEEKKIEKEDESSKIDAESRKMIEKFKVWRANKQGDEK